MNDRVTEYLLRLCAGVLTAAGVITVLVGLGALALIQCQMRIQTRRFGELTDQLDEWKQAALAEIRSFLEGSEIEVEISEPTGTVKMAAAPPRAGAGSVR